MFGDLSNDLSCAVDALVAAQLGYAGIAHPPVDAFVLARRLGIDVVLDAGQQSRGRRALVAGRSAIFIRDDPRPERRQWAVAHEIGESLVHALEGASLRGEAADPSREDLANVLASRLLLPGDWFFDDARRLGEDLLALKARYVTASHELIAWRLLGLPVPATVTVFDQGKPVRRRSNAAVRSPPLDRVELECWQDAHRFGRAVDRSSQRMRVRIWPIHEPGWKREILRTTYPEAEWGE